MHDSMELGVITPFVTRIAVQHGLTDQQADAKKHANREDKQTQTCRNAIDGNKESVPQALVLRVFSESPQDLYLLTVRDMISKCNSRYSGQTHESTDLASHKKPQRPPMANTIPRACRREACRYLEDVDGVNEGVAHLDEPAQSGVVLAQVLMPGHLQHTPPSQSQPKRRYLMPNRLFPSSVLSCTSLYLDA
jgi:hypothetical protein